MFWATYAHVTSYLAMMTYPVTRLCILVLLMSIASAQRRMILNFDFAWRVKLGNVYDRHCGVVYKDQDIGAGGSRITTSTYDDCCQACVNDSTCVAWDWDTQTSDCWLKDNADGNVRFRNALMDVVMRIFCKIT
eukprot:TRINITY_DN12269_c1_g8_i1.p1 TRINITY_DN12269_c1_g8~~TRINITY_DN12269_c1_g8_i1.p1  ORF type:complete len:134 (-),score=10.30 TRINITY_DN12269_c1_g8_i1:100-501(-)